MDVKELRKVVGNRLRQYGFQCVKNAYYYFNNDLIAVIELQKSGYGNSYYINFGFLAKEIHPDLQFPKTNVCDIMGRLPLPPHNEDVGNYDLENSSPLFWDDILRQGVENIILPVANEGMAKYYQLFPEAICSAKLATKKYLNGLVR